MIDAFAGYRFHRVLGDGSFEATELDSGEAVVIESPVGVGEDDEDLRGWFAEAWGALAELRHPSLPAVRAVGEQDGMPFAVRDPFAGSPVGSLDADEAELDAATTRVMVCRLADGLDRAHEAGVIHGGLGPDRVIAAPPGEGERVAVVVGFGRVEGLRRDDIHSLGEVIDALVALTRTSGDPEADEGAAVEGAILAMLTRVAADARQGSVRRAAEVRDAVAAGSGDQGRGPRRVISGIAAAIRDRRTNR